MKTTEVIPNHYAVLELGNTYISLTEDLGPTETLTLIFTQKMITGGLSIGRGGSSF